MINQRLAVFIFLFCVLVLNAQKAKNASISLLNDKTISIDQKIDMLCEESLKLGICDSILAFKYANSAVELAEKSNSKIKQTIAFSSLSMLYGNYGETRKQSFFADKSLEIAIQAKSKEAMAYANFGLAQKFAAIEENERYITLILKSLEYFEKTKTRYDKLVNGYENLGAYFGDVNNNILRKKYVEKALALAYESKNSINIANGLTSWGLYLENYYAKEDPKNLKILDSTENCYLKAIQLFEKNKKQLNYSYARTCLNLSSLYVYHFYETKNAKTLQYLNKAESVCLAINSPLQLMIVYGQKTQYYTNLKDIPNIELTLNKLKTYLDKQKQVDSRYKLLLYKNYMDLATLKNDFISYRKYFALYELANLEMINQDNRTREVNATIKFETDQKDTEIKALSANLENKKQINYLYLLLISLAALALILMFSTYNFRQKTFLKANLLLQKQNDEAKLLAKLKEEEAMNAMLQSELSDRELQIVLQEKILTEQQKTKLQQELMTNNLQLDRKNEVLKDIQEKLLAIQSEKSADIKLLSKTIDKSLETDEEFELLKTSFENTNPIFFETIQNKASGKLSKLDFKYCAYIKLGMSTKEIANHMHIEAQSMRMARYRIKLKLQLDKEQDLDRYIREV